MKRVNIKCPYCHSQAFLRPASVVHGEKTKDPADHLYVCARYPFCDSYVAAHRKTMLPMGTLANKELRRKRMEAHAALSRLYEQGLMTKGEAYRWLQLQLGLSEQDAHIAKFSELRCDQVIALCKAFLQAAPTAA